jgi:hypothetical protein
LPQRRFRSLRLFFLGGMGRAGFIDEPAYLAAELTSRFARDFVDRLFDFRVGPSARLPVWPKGIPAHVTRLKRELVNSFPLSRSAPARSSVLAWNPYRFHSQVAERFKEQIRQCSAQLESTNARRKLKLGL